jgi:replicative DNA helicase
VKKYRKPSSLEAGAEPIFNLSALYESESNPVFVMEGQFDAISVEQLGFNAIAVGGAGYSKLVKRLSDFPMESVLVIAFDNDKAGKENAEKFSKELSKINVAHIIDEITENMS